MLANAWRGTPNRRSHAVEFDGKSHAWLADPGDFLKDLDRVGLRFAGKFGEGVDRGAGDARGFQQPDPFGAALAAHDCVDLRHECVPVGEALRIGAKTRIVFPFRPPERAREFREQAVIRRRNHNLAVACVERLKHDDPTRPGPLTCGLLA